MTECGMRNAEFGILVFHSELRTPPARRLRSPPAPALVLGGPGGRANSEFSRLCSSRRGQILVEYFLLFAVIAMLVIIALRSGGMSQTMRASFSDFFNGAANKMAN